MTLTRSAHPLGRDDVRGGADNHHHRTGGGLDKCLDQRLVADIAITRWRDEQVPHRLLRRLPGQ